MLRTVVKRLSEVAAVANVTVERDGAFENLAFLHAEEPCALVFVENRRFLRLLARRLSVAVVLTTPDLAAHVHAELALGTCDDPRAAYAVIHNHLVQAGFYWETFPTVIDPSAAVHPSAWVSPTSVRIGRDSVVGPHATILERCVVGDRVDVGAGAILGGVGFQTVRSADMLEKRHGGGLDIHDRARVLPGAVIATGLFRRPTQIGADARIGSRGFISHAVEIGARSVVGHGTVVNGNVTIGEDVWIGAGAVVANNLCIGDRSVVSLGSVLSRDVPADGRVSGHFAIRHRRWLRLVAEADRD